jgi:hypothetical protein
MPFLQVRKTNYLSLVSWDVVSQLTFGEYIGFLQQGIDVDDMVKTANQSFTYFAIVKLSTLEKALVLSFPSGWSDAVVRQLAGQKPHPSIRTPYV